MIAKPINYLKYWNGEFQVLGLGDFPEAYKRWSPVTSSLKDIVIECYLDYAIVKLKVDGTFLNHRLDRKNEIFYEGKSKMGTSYVLRLDSYDECTLFIIIGNDCISISNKSINLRE